MVVLLMRGEGESTDSGGGYERCLGSPAWGCSGTGSGQVGDIDAKLRDKEQEEREREHKAEDLAKKGHFYETVTADMRRV